MKQLNSFMVISIGGGDRITFSYDEISEQGDQISSNNKANFFVVDNSVKAHIDAIRSFIRENKLSD